MFLVEVAFFQQIPLPIDQKSADAKNTLLTFISDKTNLLHPMLSKQDAQFQIKGQLAMTLYLKPSKTQILDHRFWDFLIYRQGYLIKKATSTKNISKVLG